MKKIFLTFGFFVSMISSSVLFADQCHRYYEGCGSCVADGIWGTLRHNEDCSLSCDKTCGFEPARGISLNKMELLSSADEVDSAESGDFADEVDSAESVGFTSCSTSMSFPPFPLQKTDDCAVTCYNGQKTNCIIGYNGAHSQCYCSN